MMSVMEKIPALIVNLERDAERRAEILGQFDDKPMFDARIVKGVAGDTLPDCVRMLLTDSQMWLPNKGALGCFLSHVRAWEIVAQLPVPFAMVLEDDSDISGLEEVWSLSIPADAEFIFLNDRMSGGWKDDEVKVTEMLHSLVRKDLDRIRPGHFDRDGFGTDGYLLTPGGARKLVEACRTDLYFGHVDGRLLRYVTAQADLDNLPDESWVKSIIMHHHHKQHMPRLGLLKGYALSRPLVRHRALDSSRVQADSE